MGNGSSQYRLENDEKVKGKGKPLFESKKRQNHCRQKRRRGSGERGQRRQRRQRAQRVEGNSKPKSKPPTWEQLKATNLKLWKTNGEKFIEIYHQTREIKELKRKLRQTRHNLEQRNKTIRDLRDLKSGNSLDESFFGNLFEE